MPALAVQKRSDQNARDIRSAGRVPGVLYGHAVENQAIECDAQEFHKTYLEAGENTVIDLDVAGKTVPVLVHALDLDPISNAYEHIDFIALDMSKKVTADIPLRLLGEAPAVKNLGGVLIHSRDTLTVTCLPKDLPHEITVDISGLENFHDTVTVESLSVPAAVTLDESPEEIVATVQPPREEEEVKPAEEEEGAVEGAEGEKAEGEKAEAGDEEKKEGEEKKE